MCVARRHLNCFLSFETIVLLITMATTSDSTEDKKNKTTFLHILSGSWHHSSFTFNRALISHLHTVDLFLKKILNNAFALNRKNKQVE